ncbi:MAG TPA: tRNA (adenosine(37)-N6)-dimethylallyltransferase MiaA [Chloroflexi bacterium]|mgnify:CR=1 FL=1|nr:tRNA (adenosine(37)-N6)-dimethylallyltransferase MiaA [Chloroflexota bacterium]|tara:strand:- start:1393 stop:2298 length:906 start_codon:yes stop_codon:yes gene_type:complete
MSSNPLIVLCGPTASGKSAAALRLAEHMPVEIVSADSRQIYRGMDVGTAKPTTHEREAVPHHLIDVVDPDETFNAYRFSKLADKAISSIRTRGNTPIVVGGTGFYIKALLGDLPLGETPPDPEIRAKLLEQLETRGLDTLVKQLEAIDPNRAASIDANNPRRVLRALEIAIAQSKKVRSHNNRFKETKLQAHVFGLSVKPQTLRDRISVRVVKMYASGLLEEAASLRKSGYGNDLASMSGIGYREALACLDGTLSCDEASEQTIIRTRQYARRQRTWFRHQLSVQWLPAEDLAVAAKRLID